MALVLKGIFSEIRYVCVLTSSVLDRGGDNFTPPPPPQKEPLKSPPTIMVIIFWNFTMF